MKKAKDILNQVNLTRMVMALAILLTLIAIFLVVTRRAPVNGGHARGDECTSIVVVESGDTLSKLLLEQGLTHNDVDAIAKTLKKDAGISTLRADSDKIEFTRPTDNEPVSKIVVIPSPWKQVELTCDGAGAWNCKTVDIERDTRAVYRAGEILDGDSFYLAGQRAGIPAAILADVYDL